MIFDYGVLARMVVVVVMMMISTLGHACVFENNEISVDRVELWLAIRIMTRVP